MFRFPRNTAHSALAALLVFGVATAIADDDERHGFGTPATPEEIAGWDIDVRPDGEGLPPGSGSVLEGEEIYLEQCAVCHGEFGEGVGRYPVLMGGFDTLTSSNPEKTVGSYWPYATTLWDYINRTMPFGAAQSLSPDQVYALSAYILFLNDIVDEDAVLDAESLPAVEMPNLAGFVSDPRPDIANEPCMVDCKDTVEITSEARTIGVTPTVNTP
jgi:cytochrome c